MIKTVIFDIGGVVVEEECFEVEKRLSRLLSIDGKELEDIKKEYYPNTFVGKDNLYGAYEKILKDLGIKMNPERVANEHLETYKEITKGVRKNILDLITKLKANYTICCLSNMESEMADWNKKRKLFDIFDGGTFLSCELGIKKPDRKCFLRVLNILKINPDEAVFIDDNPKNVEASNSLGMKGVLYIDYWNLIKNLDDLGLKKT